jgi:cyclic pyranopterin phosphate synthase
MKLSHIDSSGQINMVDISDKSLSNRSAMAEAFISLNSKTLDLINSQNISKGNVITSAKIAAIQAAKNVSQLIPLCHTIPLSWIEISISQVQKSLKIESHVKANYSTGVEMEALTAVCVAALTIYDMCKAVDKSMEISGIRVVKKTGGKSSSLSTNGS